MKDKMLTDTFEFTTPKLMEKQAGKNVHTNVEQSSMFHISAQAKYTHLKRKAAMFLHLKYMCHVQKLS